MSTNQTLLHRLRKLRFNQELILSEGTVRRSSSGFTIDHKWIAETPSQAEHQLRTFKEDPYDEATL
jgi:hypothetical protein